MSDTVDTNATDPIVTPAPAPATIQTPDSDDDDDVRLNTYQQIDMTILFLVGDAMDEAASSSRSFKKLNQLVCSAVNLANLRAQMSHSGFVDPVLMNQ